jgi:hypothetical protein
VRLLLDILCGLGLVLVAGAFVAAVASLFIFTNWRVGP